MRRRSFRRRLFLASLAASLIPLVICSALLLQIFRLRMEREARQAMADQLAAVGHSMDAAFSALEETAARLQRDTLLIRALS